MSLTSPDAQAQLRTFDAEDVFFSVTDAKGVITHANGTFLRLAHLTTEEAVGAPHNVVRHPDMPSGIFRLVWDELEAGRPVCAYMANQATDGVRYDVLATISPVEGGYLSLRLRPGVDSLKTALFEVLDSATAREQDLRATGGSRHAVAEQSAEQLQADLAGIGFGSMADFTRQVLPREIEALLAALPVTTSVAGVGPLGAILTSTLAIGRNADGLMARLGDFETLAQRILVERESVAPAVAELTSLRADLDQVRTLLSSVADTAPVPDLPELASLTTDMVGWTDEALDGLHALPTELELLQISLRDLALRVSMFVLINHMVTRFTTEVLEAGQERGAELRMLHGALAHGLVQVEEQTETVKKLLTEIPAFVETTIRTTDRVGLRTRTWYERVLAAQTAGRLGDDGDKILAVAASVRERFTTKLYSLTEIVGLSKRLRQTPVRFETAEVREQLQHIAHGVATLS